jgi:sugar/nucleoside kinase (ribokinase family)
MTDLREYILYELGHNSSPPPSVAVFGDLNYDTIYTCPPLESRKEVYIAEFAKTLAGAGGYVACGLAKLGARVSFVTDLGDDEDGRGLRGEIGLRGVNRDCVRLLAGKRSPFTLIFAEPGEERPRQSATYMGTLREFGVGGVDYKAVVSRSDLVYSCGYFLMPRLREEIRLVFRDARERNVCTAYDANAGDGWDDRQNLVTLVKCIYPHTDVVFLNEHEAFMLTGSGDRERSIRAISGSSCTVVVKLGAEGALVRHRDRLYRVSAFPARGKVRDTVGAGDAFQAAFLYFYLRKFPIEICAVMAAANASSTLARSGGTEGQLDVGGLADEVRACRVIDRGGGVISIERGGIP